MSEEEAISSNDPPPNLRTSGSVPAGEVDGKPLWSRSTISRQSESALSTSGGRPRPSSAYAEHLADLESERPPNKINDQKPQKRDFFVDDTYMTGGRTTTQKQPQLGAGTPRGHSLTMALARHEDTPTLENLSVMPAPSACIGAITAEMKLRNRSFSTAVLGGSQVDTSPSSRPGEKSIKYVAVRAFRRERDEDLGFEQGDIIEVSPVQSLQGSHWWHGRSKGRYGLFPASYVKPIESGEDTPSLLPSPEGEGTAPSSNGPDGPDAKETDMDTRITEEEISDDEGELTYEDVDEDGGSGRTTKFIASGPRGKLIEALVIPRTIPEPYYTEAFLFTRPYFISARALLRRLIHYFLDYQEPNGAKEDPADVNKLQKPIQGRVLNVLQKWVENSFHDFAEDDVLLAELVRFVADNIPKNMFAQKLIKGVRKKKREFKLVLEGEKEALIEKLFEDILPTPAVASGTTTIPDSPTDANRPTKDKRKPSKNIITTHLTIRRGHRRDASDGDTVKKLTFSEIGAKEMAVQLTLLEQEMFARIKPSELLFGNAGKKNKHQLAPHVMHLVEWFNRIVAWVASVIVLTSHLRERRFAIKRFLEIADECRKIKNYFGLQEIVSALNMACIERLQATWKGMSRQDLALFAELSGLVARGQQNYATYRSEFGCTEPPHLPFLGVHLSDLVALDQLPTWIGDPSDPKRQHVNFKKMRKLEQAARPMLSCRSYQYTTLESSWTVQRFLTQDLVVLNIQQLTELSRACEPPKFS